MTNRGGRPKVIAGQCAMPHCERRPHSRIRKPTKADPYPPTVCRSHYEQAKRATALDCSWQGCRNLRQWNKLAINRQGFCRRHERDYLWSNPGKLEGMLRKAAGNVEPAGGCLEWQLTKEEEGKLKWRGQIHCGYAWLPYRFTYTALVDYIDAGLELDHLCGSRFCILPTHLEPVTSAVNKRRDGERVNSHLRNARHAVAERRHAIGANTARIWQRPDAAERLTWFAQMAYPGTSVPDAQRLLSASSYTRELPGYAVMAHAREKRKPLPEGVSPALISLATHRKD